MNKQRGLLAAIMALVMVFAGAAFVAAEVDATDNYVAEVNGTGYEDFYTALSTATAGQTVKLLKDVELNKYVFLKDVNIDGNEKILDLNTELYIDGVATVENLTVKTGPGIGMSLWVANHTSGVAEISFNKVNVLYEGNYRPVYVQTGMDYEITFTECDFGNSELEIATKDTSENYVVSIINCTNLDLGLWMNYGTPNGGDATIGSDIILQGTDINTLYLHGHTKMIVPNGQSVKVNEVKNGWELDSAGTNGTVTVESGGSLSVETSEIIIDANPGSSVSVSSYEYADIDAAIDALNSGVDEVTIENEKGIAIEKWYTITKGNLIIKNTNISIKEGKEAGIIVQASLSIEASDVRVPIIIDEGEVIITKAKKMTVTGDSTADLGVGYGNTLVLADLTVPAGKKIQAWGTVVIEGNVTVQKGAEFDVYQGGNAKIDGTLNIEGDALVNGVADINGAVKVYYTDGDADFIVGQTGEVNVLGTMDVLKGKTKDTTNTLTIETVGDEKGELNVEGTLTVTGTLEGNVNDMGTIVFNGIAGDDAKITVFDGVTLTIASVDGELKVTDAGIIDKTELSGLNYAISTSDEVTLTDVKGITISVVVDETVKAVDETVGVVTESVKYRFYVATMTLSGTIADIDTKDKDAAGMSVVNTTGAEFGSKNSGDISWPTSTLGTCGVVINDLVVGEAVALVLNGVNVDVDGTVTVVAEDASITTTKRVTVNGTIVVGEKAYSNNAGETEKKSTLTVNGAHYEVQSADMTETTCYYTTFENALAATGIYENSIDVLGTVDIETAVDIPAGLEVTMASGSIMNIDTDGKVTVAADALLDASKAEKVDVDGMLVIMDKEYGLEGEDKVKYQVKTETEESITYCGLILALENAAAGDVIEIVGTNAVIDESVTIPEGVTLVVPNGSKLTVGDAEDKVTLTVAGTLKVDGGDIEIVGNDAQADELDTVIVIPGVVSVKGTTADEITTIEGVSEDYVKFTMKVDGKDYTVMSNLAYAAENAVNTVVYVVGDVSGGDVTFTKAEKGELSIEVLAGSTIVVGTLTLVGDGVTITAPAADSTNGTKAGVITGTIATAAGSVDLDKVSGIDIEVDVEETVDAKTDIMIVDDDATNKMSGSFTVASGTVTAATGFEMKATKDNKMSVASGATLLIDEVFTAIGTTDNSVIYDVIIDGTISIVKGGQATVSYTTVNGNIDVASAGQLTIGTNSIVTGTITVAEKTDDAEAGKAYVKNNLFVGTAPAIGATGTLVGPFTTYATGANAVSGVIVAYPGSDLTGAFIDIGTDGKSAAKSTEFYINGQLYMTAVTADDIEVIDFANDLGIEIPGLDTPQTKDTISGEMVDDIKWFIDEALKTPVTDSTKIGDSEKLYAEFAASEVDLVVSAGVGLQVYIDGLAVENFKVGDKYLITVGTHTVSFAVESGYDGSAATITVNGVQVSNNGTFTVDVDAEKITIIASGAVPAQSSGSTVIVDDADDGMALTDILLIVLVVLIVIMAIIVALRMMRS